MFGSQLLDTTIGMFFVLLLVSLLVTTANEMVAATFRSRAKWLRKGVKRLLGSEWMTKMYAHPLIDGTSLNGAGPSYIASRTYATVLLELVHQSEPSIRKVRNALHDALQNVPTETGSISDLKEGVLQAADAAVATADIARKIKSDLDTTLAAMDSRAGRNAEIATRIAQIGLSITESPFDELKKKLEELATKIESSPTDYDPKRIEGEINSLINMVPYAGAATVTIRNDLRDVARRIRDTSYTVGDAKRDLQTFIDGMQSRYLREVIAQIPSTEVRDALTALLEEAGHNIEKFKENIEIWFNNSMDRVGGWYKRKTQFVVLSLAFAITVILNVDALLILRQLNVQPALRDSLVAQAKTFAERPPVAIQQPQSASDSGRASSAAGNAIGHYAIEGGDELQGTIRLVNPPTADGTITLKTNDPSATISPQSRTVSRGDSTVAFSLKTLAVTSPKVVEITVEGASKGSATVRVQESLDAKYRKVQDQLDQLSLPIGWFASSDSNDGNKIGEPVPTDKTSSTPASADSASASKPLNQSKSPATAPGNGTNRSSEFRKANYMVVPWAPDASWYETVRFHLVGWLLVALAASMGAPFWFDMLNKVISIRSAGKAPEESPKPPKDVPVPLEPGQSPKEADRVNALRKG